MCHREGFAVCIGVLEVLLYLFEVVAVIVVGYTSSIAGVV